MIQDKSIIQYFLFDLGGVLFEINPRKLVNEFISHFKTKDVNSSAPTHDILQMDIFIDYELGNITTEEFRKEASRIFGLEISNIEFDKLWNSILIKPYKDMLNFASGISKQMDVCLLSNTNEIHFNHFYTICEKYFKNFTQQFYSYRLGLSKPQHEIFHYVMKNLNALPEQILFIDDTESNIVSASDLGIQTFHFNYRTNRSELLNNFP